MSENLGGGSLMVLMDFCQCWPLSHCYASRRGGMLYLFEMALKRAFSEMYGLEGGR